MVAIVRIPINQPSQTGHNELPGTYLFQAIYIWMYQELSKWLVSGL